MLIQRTVELQSSHPGLQSCNLLGGQTFETPGHHLKRSKPTVAEAGNCTPNQEAIYRLACKACARHQVIKLMLNIYMKVNMYKKEQK